MTTLKRKDEDTPQHIEAARESMKMRPDLQDPTVTEDAVFGTLTEEGPNYRDIGWIAAAILMMKCQIGLGVLSLPAAFDVLGLIPGIISLLAIAVTTTWSSYELGVFKLNHPQVYGFHDSMGMVFGRWGHELFSVVFSLYLIFASGSSMLGISIGLNAVSTHAMCTAGFVAIAACVVLLLASLRTLGRISWLAWIGMSCIFVALFTVVVAVSVQDRPQDAPPGPWESDYTLFARPSFFEAISAITTLIFAYTGSPFYFAIISEMRNPREYHKAMFLSQGIVTITYLVVGIVMYYFCGSFIASPALGSAGKTIKIVAYAIALPGLCVSATLAAHTVGKFFFVRILRGSKHLTSNTWIHWTTWLGCILIVVLAAYCIASSIPFFDRLVALIGALLGTIMCFQPFGIMWLYDNWSDHTNIRTVASIARVAWAIGIIVLGTFLTVTGTYGSIAGIIVSMRASEGTGVWTCVDNSDSI